MDFGALIAWLQSVWKIIWIFQIIDEYEEGVRLTFGKYTKSLKPGWHFKCSVFEKILTHYAKDDTIYMPSQKLTTIDNKTVSIRGSMLYYIEDIRLFMTEVNNPQQALSDLGVVTIAKNVMKGKFEDCCNERICKDISREVRKQAKKWGAYIVYVELTDISLSYTFNLTKDTEAHL